MNDDGVPEHVLRELRRLMGEPEPESERMEEECPEQPRIIIARWMSLYQNASAEQKLFFLTLAKRKNVVLMAAAGCGKTWALRAAEILLGGFSIFCAPTGAAANQLFTGKTIYKMFGLTPKLVRLSSLATIAEKAKKNNQHVKKVKYARFLFIDEISMVEPRMLQIVDECCKTIRESSAPFGGLTVCLCGDPAQYRPVKSSEMFFEYPQFDTWFPEETRMVFTTQFRMVCPYLSHLADCLRIGHLTDFAKEVLRYISRSFEDRGLHVPSISIAATNARVDAINLGAMRLAIEKAGRDITKTFTSEKNFGNYRVNGKEVVPSSQTAFLSAAYDLKDVPEKTTLWIGGRIKIIKNLDDKLANGTIGIVRKFLDDGAEILVDGAIYVVRIHKFVSDIKVLVREDKKTKQATLEVEQFPGVPAECVSAHAAQGSTFPGVTLYLQEVFENGGLYVPLTRGSSVSTVELRGTIPMHKISILPQVRDFLKTIKGVKDIDTLREESEMCRALWEMHGFNQ